jgi:hypothetical protein
MDRSLVLSVISSSLVAGIAGAFLGHWLAYRREKTQRLKEQRIRYLIEVYRAFSKANHHPRLYEVADELEQAVADIQLFGSPDLIRLAQAFAEELGARQEASQDELLAMIRNDLRKELGERSVSGKMIWLRIEHDKK